jgi:hypothetical protein
MDPGTLAALAGVADSLAKLGSLGLALVFGILFLRGTIRSGALVDADRDRDDAVDAKREALLTAERDAWRDRALAVEDRLDRLVNAFERIAKTAAPE